jgi:hypothetical protein
VCLLVPVYLLARGDEEPGPGPGIRRIERRPRPEHRPRAHLTDELSELRDDPHRMRHRHGQLDRRHGRPSQPAHDPHAVPGMDGDAMRAVLDQELARFGQHGIDASMVLVTFDDTAEAAIAAALADREWDVVVIGGGVRKADLLVPLLEQVVSLVRRHAPKAAIAFNTSGADSVEAAQRWL